MAQLERERRGVAVSRRAARAAAPVDTITLHSIVERELAALPESVRFRIEYAIALELYAMQSEPSESLLAFLADSPIPFGPAVRP